jgi:hypothetical protein
MVYAGSKSMTGAIPQYAFNHSPPLRPEEPAFYSEIYLFGGVDVDMYTSSNMRMKSMRLEGRYLVISTADVHLSEFLLFVSKAPKKAPTLH